MTTYNWDLIERLLHEVQNGEGSFAPRKYAEEEAAEKATAGESTGNLDALKKTAADYEALLFKRGFIESRPEEEGGNGENFILTGLGAQLLALMVLFGLVFCATAYVGYRGLEILSYIAVPAMGILLFLSMWVATVKVGGLDGLLAVVPSGTLDLSTAITLVFGTFVSGATQATNWTRFSRSAKVAVLASLIGFFVGNGLMVLIGAYGAIVYQQPDVVEVLLLQGFAMAAMAMLLLNIWSTQDNTIYNFAVAGCNLLRTRRRKTVTLAGAVIGTLLALLGMYDLLVPYLILLGTVIPPIGGVIMADFFYRYRGQYPRLAEARLPAFNWPGLVAYAVGTLLAFNSPWVAPLVGIVAASLTYVVLTAVLRVRTPLADAQA